MREKVNAGMNVNISTNCDYCEKEIELTPSKMKASKRHFCSQVCSNQFKKEQMQNNYSCDVCNTPIRLKPHQLKQTGHHDCSYQCFCEHHRKKNNNIN